MKQILSKKQISILRKLFSVSLFLFLLSIPVIGEVYYSYSRHRDYPMDPLSVNASRIDLVTSDNVKITSWYQDMNSSNIAIIVHGHFDNAAMMFERYSPLFTDNGWDVLVLDLRNHGKSDDKKPITYGVLEALDVEAAINWVNGQMRWNRTVVFGTSMGAASSLFALNTTSVKIDGLILDSIFVDIDATFKNNMDKHYLPSAIYYKPVRYYLELRYQPTGFSFETYPDIIETIQQVSRKTSILVARGSNDIEVSSDDFLRIQTEVDNIDTILVDASHSRLHLSVDFQNYLISWLNQVKT